MLINHWNSHIGFITLFTILVFFWYGKTCFCVSIRVMVSIGSIATSVQLMTVIWCSITPLKKRAPNVCCYTAAVNDSASNFLVVNFLTVSAFYCLDCSFIAFYCVWGIITRIKQTTRVYFRPLKTYIYSF